MKFELINEPFTLRSKESIQLVEENIELIVESEANKRYIAVIIRDCEMPSGGIVPLSYDNQKVESAGILACEWLYSKNGWIWISLSPVTKEIIGQLMFDAKCEHNKWYYLEITPQEQNDKQKQS